MYFISEILEAIQTFSGIQKILGADMKFECISEIFGTVEKLSMHFNNLQYFGPKVSHFFSTSMPIISERGRGAQTLKNKSIVS